MRFAPMPSAFPQFQALPDLCLHLVGDALCEDFALENDAAGAAACAASMACVGNALFSEFADRLFDRVVDHGCTAQKADALAHSERVRARWAVKAHDESHSAVANSVSELSKRTDIVRACTALGARRTGSKSALLLNLRDAEHRERGRNVLYRLLLAQPPPVKRLTCPVREGARLVAWSQRVYRDAALTVRDVRTVFKISAGALNAYGVLSDEDLARPPRARAAIAIPAVVAARVRAVQLGVRDVAFFGDEAQRERECVAMYEAHVRKGQRQRRMHAALSHRKSVVATMLEQSGVDEKYVRRNAAGDYVLALFETGRLAPVMLRLWIEKGAVMQRRVADVFDELQRIAPPSAVVARGQRTCCWWDRKNNEDALWDTCRAFREDVLSGASVEKTALRLVEAHFLRDVCAYECSRNAGEQLDAYAEAPESARREMFGTWVWMRATSSVTGAFLDAVPPALLCKHLAQALQYVIVRVIAERPYARLLSFVSFDARAFAVAPLVNAYVEAGCAAPRALLSASGIRDARENVPRTLPSLLATYHSQATRVQDFLADDANFMNMVRAAKEGRTCDFLARVTFCVMHAFLPTRVVPAKYSKHLGVLPRDAFLAMECGARSALRLDAAAVAFLLKDAGKYVSRRLHAHKALLALSRRLCHDGLPVICPFCTAHRCSSPPAEHDPRQANDGSGHVGGRSRAVAAPRRFWKDHLWRHVTDVHPYELGGAFPIDT